jgi:hypothetical protein
MDTPTPTTEPARTGQKLERAAAEASDAGLVTTESIIEVEQAMSSTPTVSYQAPESTHGLQDQSIRLPFHRLLLIYFGIGTALFVSFLDQTSVSTAAPVIGGDIGGSER